MEDGSKNLSSLRRLKSITDPVELEKVSDFRFLSSPYQAAALYRSPTRPDELVPDGRILAGSLVYSFLEEV